MQQASFKTIALPPPPRAESSVSDSGRSDGRGYEEFRPVFLKTKVNSQATGSAYAEFENTKAMVAVYGPRQSERKYGFTELGRLACDVTIAAFDGQQRNKQGVSSTLEREYSSALQQALTPSILLHKMPRSVVDISVMLLQSGGADLAVITTAASMALADAGIPLYDLVPACQVSQVHNHLLLDPTVAEEANQQSSLILAMMPSANEVTATRMVGSLSGSQWKEALELAVGGCSQLKAVMREVLLQQAQAQVQA